MCVNVRLLLFGFSTHEHGHAGMVHDVVTDASQEGPSNGAQTSGPCDNQVPVFVSACLDDSLAWLVAHYTLHFATELKIQGLWN